MIEDMKLAGLAAGTQTTYIDAVRKLAAHYRRSPDQLSEEEVRAYLALHFWFCPSSSTADKAMTICARGSEVISARLSRRTPFAAAPRPIRRFLLTPLEQRRRPAQTRRERRRAKVCRAADDLARSLLG